MKEQESFNPIKHKMEGGKILKGIINKEERLPFGTKVDNAKKNVETLLKGENGDAVAELAKKLMEKNSANAIRYIDEETLQEKAGELCTAAELAAACEYIYDHTN